MNLIVKMKALTPIAHGDVVSNLAFKTNTSLFMRSGLVVNGFADRIPALSETALRSVIFRKTLAQHLFSFLGLDEGGVSKAVTGLFFSGGNMVSGGKSPSGEQELSRLIYQAFPCLELLGGSTDNFILPTSRLRVACWPVTEEYAEILEYVAPETVEKAKQISAYDMLKDETGTRGTSGSDDNQMLFTFETLCAGAEFVMRLSFTPNASPLCLSAAAFALELWDGYFGGKCSSGHGLMAVQMPDFPVSSQLYLDYLTENKATLKEAVLTGKLGTDCVICSGDGKEKKEK